MQRFYEHLQAGLNKKQALRQAKLDYLDKVPAEKRDPFYWAPFILIGDWSSIDIPRGKRWSLAYWIGAFALLVVVSIGVLASRNQRLSMSRRSPS
jgi:hypothetical protein